MRRPQVLATLVLVGLASGGSVAPSAAAGGPEPSGAMPLFRIQDPGLAESSGIALSTDDDVVYVVEDAGRPATVVALDYSGRTRAVVTLEGQQNVDWEDLDRALVDGRQALVVADTGDAFFTRRETGEPPRTEFLVHVLAEPQVDLSGTGAQQLAAQDLRTIRFSYPDGEARNAESLAVQPSTQVAVVVDKTEDAAETARAWSLPLGAVDESVTLEEIAPVPVTQATSAAFSPDGRLFAVRDYRYAHVWEVDDGDLAGALAGRPRRVLLPQQPQGESLTFSADGAALVVGSEGAGRGAIVWEVALPDDLLAQAQPEPVAQSATPDRSEQVETAAVVMVGAVLAAGAVLLVGVLRGAARRRGAAPPRVRAGSGREEARRP